MKQIGIEGNLYKWVVHCLSKKSVTGDCWSGFRMGASYWYCPSNSVLGTILFIIYITDINVGLHNFITKSEYDSTIGNSAF